MIDYYIMVVYDGLKEPFFVSLMTDREEALKAARDMPGGRSDPYSRRTDRGRTA